jgi:hypothetical protein
LFVLWLDAVPAVVTADPVAVLAVAPVVDRAAVVHNKRITVTFQPGCVPILRNFSGSVRSPK